MFNIAVKEFALETRKAAVIIGGHRRGFASGRRKQWTPYAKASEWIRKQWNAMNGIETNPVANQVSLAAP